VTSDVPIKVDSYATLEPQGITGVNYVQITAGSPNKELLKDTVKTGRSRSCAASAARSPTCWKAAARC
jgi:ABC-type transporter Mla subunit MlaD